jgi:peptidoglycan hydrolase-like amidase
MFLKSLKRGFLATILVLSLGAMASKSFAMDYSMHEVDLDRISSSIQEDRLFNAVTIQADKEVDGLEVDFGRGWEEVDIHDHGYGYDALIFTSPTNSVRFKSSSPANLKTYIFFSDEIGGQAFDTSDLYASTQVAVSNTFKVISRNEWGADESLRYWTPEMEELYEKNGSSEKTSSDPCGDFATEFKYELEISYTKETDPSGNLLTWPLAYAKTLRKFIIHHTDSEIRDITGDNRMDSRDYKAMIRAIYYYHTITRGWGDIGYNYIIDPLGNIYEGRYGGDKVIGAHAACFNNSSMGIAIIGNYQDDDVPEPALQALISLLAVKSKAYGIDPDGSSVFRGKKLPNIIGHRDVRATACPGDKLYNLLPQIRDRVALVLRSGSFSEGNLQIENLDYNAQTLDDYSNTILRPNERKKLTLKFKNTGQKTWDHNTWLHAALNNNPNARVVPLIEDKAFVAADLNERSVPPGQVGSFDIEIEGGYTPGNYSFEVAPVVNGRYKVSRAATRVAFTVQQPVFDYEIIKSSLPSGVVFQGEKLYAWIELKNTGNVTWKNYGDNQAALGTSSPRDRKSIFIEENPSRIGYLAQSEVEPEQVGTFVMDLDVPVNKTGMVIEQFTPVVENIGWMQDKALGFKVTIKEPNHLARVTKLNDVTTLRPGEMFKIELKMENLGDLAWDMDNMEVTFVNRGLNVFKNHLVPLEPVEPGKYVNFDFWVQAPYEEGYHSIYLKSKFNEIPIRGGTARYAIRVAQPALRAELVDQGEKYVTIRPGEEKEVTVKFKNTGNVIWRNKGLNVVHLGTADPRDRLSRLYCKDLWQNKYRPTTLKEVVVYPGEIGTFSFKVKPENRGIYAEGFQVVLENVGWVADGNVHWYFRVFGNPVETETSSNSTSTTDSEINKQRIISTATTKTTSSVTTQDKSVQYTPPTVTEKPFRVRLSYSDENSVLTADKNYAVTDGNNNQLFTLSAGEEISARRLNGNIHVQVGSVTKSGPIIRLIPEEGGIMEIKTWDNHPAWNRALNDNKFREIIEIRVINDQIAYINELPLEEYLKGLGEVSNDAPFEKQKAIAVLARTYARFYMEDENRKFPGLPYDGSDDPAVFQRYLGYGLEIRSPNFVGAVATTENEVVTYQGALVKTPYFNQSDGRTYSAKEVWGWTNTPYLQSVADPWCNGLVKRGHGVGMSGCGATAQANEGKTYDVIIKYYYQGVKIEELEFE